MNSEKYARLLDRVKEKTNKLKKAVTEAVSAVRERDVLTAGDAVPAPLWRILKPALCTVAAFMLAGTKVTFGASPFGIAFFAACGQTMVWAYVGAILRVLADGRDVLISLAAYTLTLVLRLLAGALYPGEAREGRRLPEGSLRVRMAISVIGGAALGAYAAIAGGFSLASLGCFVLMCTLCPALTLLYYGALTEKKESFLRIYREAGEGAVAVSLAFSLSGIAPLSIDLSVVYSFLLVQYVSTKRGWIKGAVVGLFCGLCMPVPLVPIFALAAVSAGLLYRASAYFAVAVSVMVSLSWTVYAGGYLNVLSTAPGLIVGGVLTAALFAAEIITVSDRKGRDDAVPHEALLAAERERTAETGSRLSSEADAFTALSEMLFRLSDRLRRPSVHDIRQTAEAESAAHCRRCRGREFCWTEHSAELSDAVYRLSETLYSSGVITSDDVPDALSEYCRDPEALIDRINLGYSGMLENLIERDKTEIMAFDYGAMSAVLRDVITQRDGEYEINARLSSALSELLRKNRISARRVCVFGERRRTVFISDIRLSGLHIGEDDLRRLAERACGGRFGTPSFELSGAYINATLTGARAFDAVIGTSQSKKDESTANGDVAVDFECRDDRRCVLLSDGMGSGREAALTSGMCALFIEKMMSAGNSASVTLKMLNCFLRARGSECSSTVDLFELDLLNGKGRFIKSGAAPSYVVRGSSVYKISSRTIPVGIMKALDAEETTVDLSPGDLVVLVSDGITKDDGDCAWLYSLLADSADAAAEDTAAANIREAERRGGRDDDATVCAVRITKPKAEETF